MKVMKLKFAEKFKKSLIVYYGYNPKNSEVALLISTNISPVTTETVRRWRLGLNLPEIETLKKISQVLDIDLTNLFEN